MTDPTTLDPTTPADEVTAMRNDQELAALKGAADGERFGNALVAMHTYAKAFSDAANAVLAQTAPLANALAQMAHTPAVANAERPDGPGEGDASQTPDSIDAATGLTGGAQ